MTTAIRTASIFLWIFLLSAALLLGQGWAPARELRAQLDRQWKPSLVIALLYMVSSLLGGAGVFPWYSIAVFCQAMIGLALARGIHAFEPLPLARAAEVSSERMDRVSRFLQGVLLIALAALVVNGLLGSLLLQLFGETMGNSQGIADLFPSGGLQSFFLMLAGAGLYEETLFRLVCVSFFWRLTRRPGVAILLSALLFGAYHLSPLDSAYLQYGERPWTILSLSTTMGVVMGYAYQRYGYETVVLGHTLGNWVALLLSRAA